MMLCSDTLGRQGLAWTSGERTLQAAKRKNTSVAVKDGPTSQIDTQLLGVPPVEQRVHNFSF
jgi:hypothetical protein